MSDFPTTPPAAPQPAPPAGSPEANLDTPLQRSMHIRPRLGLEVAIILALTLGRSAAYALVNIIDMATRGPIGEQTTAINTSQSARPMFDLVYQMMSLTFTIVPVLLVIYLLADSHPKPWRMIGLDFSRIKADIGWGFALAGIIGIPGLAIYLLGRELGITVGVVASGLNPAWWTVAILCLSALKNGLIEEVIAVAYLDHRLRALRWSIPAIIIFSSVLRGGYHLYQGWGPFAANIAMGVVFCLFYYSKWGKRRVMPLVLAHTFIDIAAFVGYAYLPASWLASLGVI